MTATPPEEMELHPFYSQLPSYITPESVVQEREELVSRVQETLSVLHQLRTDPSAGTTSVKLQKRHFRDIEKNFKLKHALPKELHKQLIESLVWHLWENDALQIVDINMEVRAVETLRMLLSKWTSKRPPSERVEIVLQWRLAKRAIERVCFSSPGQQRLASPVTLQTLATAMIKCVEKARPHFRSGASLVDGKTVVSELWETLSLQIKDIKSNQCFKALGFFTMLFNIPPSSSSSSSDPSNNREWQAIEKLVPEWLQSWASISRCSEWDGHWFKVFSRVAKRFPEEASATLRDALPFLFAKVHDLLSLPSDLGSPFKNNAWPTAFAILHGTKRSDQHAMRLCVYLMGNPVDGVVSLANQYVIEILTTVKPFFHPSNASQAANGVGVSVYFLSSMISRRLGVEKATTRRLHVESCREVFDALLELAFYGIYSKSPSVASKCMYLIKSLVCIDPTHCAKPVLDEMVKALDPRALSQSHMAPAAISSLSVFLYHLMCGQNPHGSGLLFSTYLAPLLRQTLPGIDPNDEKKTMSTVTLYFHVLSWLPLVNDVEKKGGDKVLLRTDDSNAIFQEMGASLFSPIVPNGAEIDRKQWELGSFLEEWSLALLDRCFEFIRTRANTQTHDAASQSSSGDGHDHHGSSHGSRGEDRVVLEVLNMMSLVYTQMSPAIYRQALRKTLAFVANSFFTSSFGGKVISTLVFDCLQGNVSEALPQFMRLVVDKLHNSKVSTTLMVNEKVWYLRILNGMVRFNDADHAVLLTYKDEIRAILLQYLLEEGEKQVYTAAGDILEELLHALVGVYPLDFRSLPPREWAVATSETTGMSQFLGAAIPWKRLDLQWHEPNEDELVFAHHLLEDHLLATFKTLEQLRASKDVTVRQWLPHLRRVYVAVRGARNIFVDETSGKGALQAGSLPLLVKACGTNTALLDAYVSLKKVAMTEMHTIATHWQAHGHNGVTENQVWQMLLKVIKQLLVWRGSHLYGHRAKEKQNVYIKATTTDVASRQFQKTRRFEQAPLDVVPLSSRNEMTERLLFFYSKRKVQEHFETASHVLSDKAPVSPLRAQYEDLLLDVEGLMKHPYEEVRKSAHGVMLESNEIFAKWVYTRISSQLDVLEGKIVDADGHVKEETISGALGFFSWAIVSTRLWGTRDASLMRMLKAVLRSNETVVKKLETEASKAKIGVKIQALFLSLLAKWRYVRGVRSVDMVNELLQCEPAATEHWKNQLMHMVCFFPWLQRQEAPLPIALWQLIIKQLRHDVLPVRQVAVLLFAQLVKLHKEQKSTDNGAKSDEIDVLLFADSTLKALVDSFVDNHRNTHRFAASADGQHANSAPSDWSFGVNEVIRYLSNTSTAYPKPLPLSSIRLLNQTSDLFKSLEMAQLKLVTKLCQMNPTRVTQGCVPALLEELTSGIDAKVSDEDRQAALSTLGEWIGGMLRGLLKLPATEDAVASSAVSSILSLAKKVLPHVNITLVEPWAQVLYYVARPSNQQSLRLNRLEPVVSYVLHELEQSFARATAEDYAHQVKWLTLVEPLLVQILGARNDATIETLRVTLRDSVSQVIETHALTHKYKMVRERVAKTLFILDASCDADSPVRTKRLSKLTELTHLESTASRVGEEAQQEEDADALSAKETAMMWLLRADHSGDNTDFVRVMKALFPIAFLTQNHSKVEIALLAKNVTNSISLSLRLHAPPGDHAGAAHLDDLLMMLEQFASHELWKTRGAVLRFLTSFTFYHWIYLSSEQRQRVQTLVMSFLADEQREVQDMAKYTLRSLAHVQRSTAVDILSRQLTEQAQDSRVKHPKFIRRLQKQEQENADADEIAKSKTRVKKNEKKMATSVLGMSAIVLAFPYSVPAFVPPLFEEMGRYLYIKQSTPTVSYLEKAVKDTLLEFKRTHQDNWLEIKNSFTQAQRDVFEDVLISPSYYT